MPAQKSQSGRILNFLAWFTGVVVSLVVGNAMASGNLVLPVWLGGTIAPWLAQAVGWIVIITTLAGVVMAILKR